MALTVYEAEMSGVILAITVVESEFSSPRPPVLAWPTLAPAFSQRDHAQPHNIRLFDVVREENVSLETYDFPGDNFGARFSIIQHVPIGLFLARTAG